MSTELFPSSQGNRRTVLILTGSNKRDHLLGYFIISLFICMWALQEASNLPPDAHGWREAAMAARFLGQGPDTWWVLGVSYAGSGVRLQWSLWVPPNSMFLWFCGLPLSVRPWAAPSAALQADVICTHHYVQKSGWKPKGQQVGQEISQVGIAQGSNGGNGFSWQFTAFSLQRWKEPSSDSNCSNQSKSHLATCPHDIFLPAHGNRNEFSGCVWRQRFQRFYRRISYTFQLSVLEKEIEAFLLDFEEGCGEHKSEQKRTPCTSDWWYP